MNGDQKTKCAPCQLKLFHNILACQVGTRCVSESVRGVGPRLKNSSPAAVDVLCPPPTKKAQTVCVSSFTTQLNQNYVAYLICFINLQGFNKT